MRAGEGQGICEGRGREVFVPLPHTILNSITRVSLQENKNVINVLIGLATYGICLNVSPRTYRKEANQSVNGGIFTHLASLAGCIPACNWRAGGAAPTGRRRRNLHISLQEIYFK